MGLGWPGLQLLRLDPRVGEATCSGTENWKVQQHLPTGWKGRMLFPKIPAAPHLSQLELFWTTSTSKLTGIPQTINFHILFTRLKLKISYIKDMTSN